MFKGCVVCGEVVGEALVFFLCLDEFFGELVVGVGVGRVGLLEDGELICHLADDVVAFLDLVLGGLEFLVFFIELVLDGLKLGGGLGELVLGI